MIPEQETFDTVARHLLAQGERAWVPGGCAYRDDNGRKCAVGCLIPDEQYVPEVEGKLVAAVADLVPALREHSHNLLVLLQGIHDEIRPELWSKLLRALAKERGLSTAVLGPDQERVAEPGDVSPRDVGVDRQTDLDGRG